MKVNIALLTVTDTRTFDTPLGSLSYGDFFTASKISQKRTTNNFQMLAEAFITLRLLQPIYMKIQEPLFKNILMLKTKMKSYLQKVRQRH